MGRFCSFKKGKLLIHGSSFVYNVIASVLMLGAIGSSFGFSFAALSFSELNQYSLSTVRLK